MAILTVFSIIMATAAILLLLGMLKLKHEIRGLVEQRLGMRQAHFRVWQSLVVSVPACVHSFR